MRSQLEGKSILIISHDAGRTGAPIGLLALFKWLVCKAGCTVGVILGGGGALEEEFRELGPTLKVEPHRFWKHPLGRRLRRLVPPSMRSDRGRLQRFAKNGAYDLIYSNTVMNGELLEGLSGMNVPVLTHVHELSYWIWRGGEENFSRVTTHTDHFIAVSQAVSDNLTRNHGISKDRISVVYEHIRELPAVPTSDQRLAARTRLGIPEDALVLGGCGAEHWRKGKDLIPQLLLELRRADPLREWHFVWVGHGGTDDDEYTLRYDLDSAGLGDHFHASGEVDDPFAFFAGFDVFALLSRDDPYPLACLEVAATTCPVVCFEGGGGIPEFAMDGCGFVAPYLDLGAMAGQIAQLGADPALRQRCGERARSKVAAESLLDATAPQLVAVMDALFTGAKTREI